MSESCGPTKEIYKCRVKIWPYIFVCAFQTIVNHSKFHRGVDHESVCGYECGHLFFSPLFDMVKC